MKAACGIRFFSSGPAKVGPKSLHRVGSVTKTFTAAVVLTLARDGALSIDDKVSRWVGGVPSGDVITIRDLLRHTSGLFDYTTDNEFFSLVTATRRWAPAEPDAAYFPDRRTSVVSIVDTDYPAEDITNLMSSVWLTLFATP